MQVIMVKALTFLVCLVVISIDSSESVTIPCNFQYNNFGNIAGNLYTCRVTSGVTINSPDEAYVNTTTGSHQSGHTNDNVNYLYFYLVVFSYFPRGFDAIFKNIKGIYVDPVGLKEIHQLDLKPFPKLVEFRVHSSNQLEVLEEGLFDFNLELEYIYLLGSKITYIDPNVFDSLTKLRFLYLNSNTCISKDASDRTSVQNLITELKSKCNNSDYSSLDQKLKFLESESNFLNSNDLKVELENLESKINASKFVNFYQTKLISLKSILANKSYEIKNCSTLNVKFLNLITNLKNLTSEAENFSQGSNNETVNHQCMRYNENFENIAKNVDDKIVNLSDNILNISQTVAKIEVQISSLKESFLTFNKEASIKDNFSKISKNHAKLNDEIENINTSVEDINKKLDELKDSINSISSSTSEKVETESKATTDVIAEVVNKAVERIEKNLMEKLVENLKEINGKVDESEKRFNERTAKILKALKVIFDVSDMALNYSLQ